MKKVIKHRSNFKNDSKSAEKARVAALLHSSFYAFYMCFSLFQRLEAAVTVCSMNKLI